jgi:hypothetical protein
MTSSRRPRRLFTSTGLDRQIPLARTVTEARQNLEVASGIMERSR